MLVTWQAIFVAPESASGIQPYSGSVKNGKRSPIGERIAQARQAAGLSQVELARKLGVTQQMVGYLERQPVALRPELLLQLSSVLEISVDELLGQPVKASRATGPTGKLRQLFATASKLPRAQQEKLLSVLEPFVKQHAN